MDLDAGPLKNANIFPPFLPKRDRPGPNWAGAVPVRKERRSIALLRRGYYKVGGAGVPPAPRHGGEPMTYRSRPCSLAW